MAKKNIFVVLVSLIFCGASALQMAPYRSVAAKASSACLAGACLSAPLVALAADDYEYGAVAAPGWVLPVGVSFTLISL